MILIVVNYGRQQSDLPWSAAQEPSLEDEHLFSLCGPDIWNNLPTNLRLIDSHTAFQRVLMTRLFNTALNS